MSLPVIEFLNKHNIKWMPINLYVPNADEIANGVKKELRDVPHALYRGAKPKMTDFVELSDTHIKARQTIANLYDYIAIDTNNIHHIDIDTPDCPDKYLEIAQTAPWVKSVSKSYGKHIFVVAEGKTKDRDVVYETPNGDVEMLMGQWSYCHRDAMIQNAEADIPYFVLDDLRMTTTTPKPKKLKLVLQTTKCGMPPTTNMMTPEDIDKLDKIQQCWKSTRLSGYGNFMEFTFAMINLFGESGKQYWDSVCSKYPGYNPQKNYDTWNSCSAQSGSHKIGWKRLFDWAKEDNLETYKRLFPSTKQLFFEKQFAEHGILMEEQHDRWAKMCIERFKNDMVFTNNILYLYHNDEWVKSVDTKYRLLKAWVMDVMVDYDIIGTKIYKERTDKYRTEDGQWKKNPKKKAQPGEAGIRSKEELEEDKAYCDYDNMRRLGGAIRKISFVNSVADVIINCLVKTSTDVVFDISPTDYFNIHFQNGVYDLNTNTFRERKQTDYITKWLPYDYIPATEISQEIKDDVLDFFKKIQPDEQQRMFTLSYLYYSITGANNEQIMKMNVGHTACNGKSTELAIHEKCFPIYTRKVDNRCFEKDFPKRHKFMLDCFTDPIRLVYVEELSKKKLDNEFVKDWVDGKKVSCEMMYGTSVSVAPQAKLVSCSQYDPNFENDTGILRRVKIQKYTSQFVKPELVDEANHKYLRVSGVETKFDNPLYKNAYFHLLMANTKLIVPSINEEEIKDVLADKDTLLKMITKYFVITGKENDKIHKSHLEQIPATEAEIKEKLKALGCSYQKDGRFNKMTAKGVWKGIRHKTEEELREEEEPQEEPQEEM